MCRIGDNLMGFMLKTDDYDGLQEPISDIMPLTIVVMLVLHKVIIIIFFGVVDNVFIFIHIDYMFLNRQVSQTENVGKTNMWQ